MTPGPCPIEGSGSQGYQWDPGMLMALAEFSMLPFIYMLVSISFLLHAVPRAP